MKSPGGNHPSKPVISKPASWVVDKRIRARRGGSPIRTCPDDFEETFVEIGRLACEEHYRTRRKAVTRWLDEVGKFRLIELRREHVRRRMAEARLGKVVADKVVQLEAATLAVLAIPDPRVAALAADYLRTVRGGGWAVSMTTDGDWIVGIARKTAAELIARAERYGFDTGAAALRDEGGSGVGCAG